MGLVVVVGISIVDAKRWKGGLGFGACYLKKVVSCTVEKVKKKRRRKTKIKRAKQAFFFFEEKES